MSGALRWPKQGGRVGYFRAPIPFKAFDAEQLEKYELAGFTVLWSTPMDHDNVTEFIAHHPRLPELRPGWRAQYDLIYDKDGQYRPLVLPHMRRGDHCRSEDDVSDE